MAQNCSLQLVSATQIPFSLVPDLTDNIARMKSIPIYGNPLQGFLSKGFSEVFCHSLLLEVDWLAQAYTGRLFPSKAQWETSGFATRCPIH